ncbi:MAG: GNAT family N-acetyltransferase [Thermoguttaceae bacterium]|jgi:predicted N-acyltransferase|nr:GNAT family N-acetyltransferase [Thermoguttaceae bacterium]
MTFRYEIYDAIDQVPAVSWQSVCPPGSDIFMDARLLRVFEQTLAATASFHYVVVYDSAGSPVAAACLSMCELDAALFCSGFVANAIRCLRRIWPSYLKFRTLFCGLPFSAGQCHVRVSPAASSPSGLPAVAGSLHAAALSLARRHRLRLIVFKEFSAAEETMMRQLERLGYIRGESLPMNCAGMRFSCLDDFCACLRSHYRYKINRSRRKFHAAGLRVEHLAGQAVLDAYTDEVHCLYDAVVDAADVHLERLPARFFRELASALPENVKLTTARYQGRIVAFAWSLFADDVYRDLFVGIDYNLNLDCDLYFNLMLNDLDAAFRTGAREIYMGQTADVFKSRLGCRQEARYVCARVLPTWLKLPFRATSRWLFPPPAPAPARDLFRDSPLGPLDTPTDMK